MSSYVGSKGQAGVFQRIIGQMPPHSVYVEPFFGSGQVFNRKKRAASSILIDLSTAAIAKVSAEAGVRALVGDAFRILPCLTLPADAVVYCDPPYLMSTRAHRRYYDHEMTDAEHAQLLTMLQVLKCRVLLSGYPSKLYGAALQSWRCIRYRTRTRGRTVTECLWCNFPEPAELHDWRYAGQSFRQRLAFKRLAARWLARLDRMPARKRGYVLDAVHQRYPWGLAACGQRECPCQETAPAMALGSATPKLALAMLPNLRESEAVAPFLPQNQRNQRGDLPSPPSSPDLPDGLNPANASPSESSREAAQ